MEIKKEIKDLLPHRDPFLFVDRVEEATEKRIVAYRRYKESEFFFPGHFPGYPIVPGVILLETMAQCGGAGVKLLGKYPPESLFYLASIESAKFRNPVTPGMEVRFEIENLRLSSKLMKQEGRGFVGDEMIVEARWLCIIKEET